MVKLITGNHTKPSRAIVKSFRPWIWYQGKIDIKELKKIYEVKIEADKTYIRKKL